MKATDNCFSVAKSCPTLCDPMDCNMPGFPVPHLLPDLSLNLPKFMSIESVRPIISGRGETGIYLFPEIGVSLVAQLVKNPPAEQESWVQFGFDPWVGKIPWRRKWQPTPISLPGKSHRQRSLMGYSTWGRQRAGHDFGLP